MRLASKSVATFNAYAFCLRNAMPHPPLWIMSKLVRADPKNLELRGCWLFVNQITDQSPKLPSHGLTVSGDSNCYEEVYGRNAVCFKQNVKWCFQSNGQTILGQVVENSGSSSGNQLGCLRKRVRKTRLQLLDLDIFLVHKLHSKQLLPLHLH